MQTIVLQENFESTDDTLAPVVGWSEDIFLRKGKTYRVTGHFSWNAGLTGVQIDFGGGTVEAEAMDGDASASNNYAGTILPDLTTGIACADGSGTVFSFTITPSVSGTLVPRFAQLTSHVNPAWLTKYATVQAVRV